VKSIGSNGKRTTVMSPESGSREFTSEIFQFFFDTYPDAVLICSLDGKIIRSNRAIEKLFGFSGNELVQLPLFALLPDHISDKLPSLLQKEQKKGGLTMELPVLTKNGKSCNAEMRTRLARFRNETFRYVIFRPISECKAPASSVHAVSDKVIDLPKLLPDIFEEPEMVFEINTDEIIITANNLCFEKTGYTKSDLRKGIPFTQILAPDEIERGHHDFGRLLRNEKLDALEYIILRKDGTSFPAMISFAKIVSEGRIKGIRGVALDISEHKRIEQNLMIKEKLNILGEIAGGVVHNFNNILSVILGYIDLFPFGSANQTCCEIINKIHQAALDGTEIVKRIQNFSQIRETFTRDVADINEIICDVIEFIKPMLSDGKRTITVNTQLRVVPPVLIVPFEMREVLSNIMINSIYAMPSGGEITITTGVRNGFVFVTVSDTGVGMSEETKRRLFEPFFTTKMNQGTGIGMSVSYAIINKFGGEIQVESEEGIGTSITILLPFSDKREPSGVPNVCNSTRWGALTPLPRSILVIDDEENICKILEEYLTREGHDVVTAQSGGTGLDILSRRSFDIVITDLNMPRISGWDIARQIKRESPGTVTIMLTGWGTNIEELNRRENVVDRLIFKPINFSTLSGIIAETVAGK
jgi:PAS domain S-box-containing protein